MRHSNSGHLSVAVVQNLLERTGGMQEDAFCLGLFHFPLMRRHLFPGLETCHVHFARAQASGRPGNIDGDIAAAQHHHALPGNIGRVAQTNVAQEGGIEHDAGKVSARNRQLDAVVSAHGDQHGPVTLVEKRFEFCHRRVEPQFHAKIENVLYFAVDHRRREAEFRHAHPHHSPRHRERLKYGDRVA